MQRLAVSVLRIPALVALSVISTTAFAQLTLEDAVERVQQEIQGRVLKAEEVTIGKKKLYRIKLLTRDGRVQVVKIPADENKESR
jgi:ethanolamine utilization protein EutQ (cupin superfamily)